MNGFCNIYFILTAHIISNQTKNKMRYNNFLLALVLIFAVMGCQNLVEQEAFDVASDDPMSRSEINELVMKQLNANDDVFNWANADDRMLWSAVVNSDSLVTIGYKPAGVGRIDEQIHVLNLNDSEWKRAREKILNYVVTQTNNKYGTSYTAEQLMPYGEQRTLPYLDLYVFDAEIISAVRKMPEVRYLEPTGYGLEEVNFRSDSGCGSYDASVDGNDYTAISPASRRSWHHDNHNIDDAQNNSNKGDNIWVAVIDTGVDPGQDKLNGEFAEGQSTGRARERKGFYKTGWWWNKRVDGPDDKCGHGTAMCGLVAAPRGFDNTPAGVAYECNLISYRATSDVIINGSDEKNGVADALVDAGNQSKVKIISMSIGDVFSSGKVADAVRYANNRGKLIFAAAGTSLSWTSWWGVIFPANMDETVAVTGIRTGSPRQRCNTCHDGSKVDFVIEMQRRDNTSRLAVGITKTGNDSGYIGGSSAATATTAGIAALVWSDYPSWSKSQVWNRLKASADYYPGRNGNFGWGKLDANQAVQ